MSKMRTIIFINYDIHCAKVLNLILPKICDDEIKIFASQTVGAKIGKKNLALPKQLEILKFYEQNQMDQLFSRLDQNKSSNRNKNFYQHNDESKFKSFNQIAEVLKTKIILVENVNSAEFVESTRKFKPDLIISVRFGQIFKQEIIDIPKFGTINLHSGILPKYRGILASFWSILNGERNIGTTLHYINDAKIDEGEIINFSQLKIDFNSSLIVNIHSLYKDGSTLLLETIEKIRNQKKIQTIKQSDFEKANYFSYPQEKEIEEFLKIMPITKEEDLTEIYQKWIY